MRAQVDAVECVGGGWWVVYGVVVAQAIKLCDRNFGIGGDGVIFALPPDDGTSRCGGYITTHRVSRVTDTQKDYSRVCMSAAIHWQCDFLLRWRWWVWYTCDVDI